MRKTAVVNIVALSQRVLGEHTPFLNRWMVGKSSSVIEPVFPALTCSAQSTYLTGTWPQQHGIVGNGWYVRDEDEVRLWRQSNKLVQSEKLWEIAKKRNPAFTCANLFWWYNMNTSVDIALTPRPQYRADGQKIPDCYSNPADLRDRLQRELGDFPLFHFWGPKADITSSRWIAEASLRILKWFQPTLLLVYLPHLDYSLQKFGPHDPISAKEIREIDRLCKGFFMQLEKSGREIIVLSEYGITAVSRAVHINRELRKRGLLRVRTENGRELLDPGMSDCFALADHQIAHIYINRPAKRAQIKSLLESLEGIAMVLDKEGKKKHHLDHPRCGELVCVASPEAWFTYYYWMEDKRAPDFATTVDIHRKPGYDPVEMFLDPKKKCLTARILFKLIKKRLGFRTLMDFIPLDASLIRGSHGQINVNHEDKTRLDRRKGQ